MSFAVAIDGPAAAGKGTIARAVAAHFGLAHLDTGLLYRAVGREMLAGRDPVEAAETLTADTLEDEGSLRTQAVAEAASRVAVIPEVRAAMLDFQRAFAARSGGAVLDGRDIGTVVVPDAAVKLFVTATPEIRARRRVDELVGRGYAADYAEVLEDVRARDARDRDRAASPLIPAEDAVLIDTSALSVDAAIARAIAVVDDVRRGRASGDARQ
ncbi:(d)CMP kinase [Rhodobacterales bacterium HKCCE3408]|nr:(d)CMP kinase [Rhodobacterales bacterium HKCCE3408]